MSPTSKGSSCEQSVLSCSSNEELMSRIGDIAIVSHRRTRFAVCLSLEVVSTSLLIGRTWRYVFVIS